jgi:shikimate kinase
MNVTLIGMSGAGKSRLGEKLAERLGLTFLDVDRHLLEPAHGKPLQDILDELGDEHFVDWEEKMMLKHTKGKDNMLISTPGSVVYEPEVMRHLRDISHIIYLRVPYDVVEERIGHESKLRGIVGRGSKTLRELYEERHPLYEKYAHLILDTYGREADDMVNEVVKLLDERAGGD